MAFIEVIAPKQAAAKLAKLYKMVRSPDGQVDNVLQVHSLRPHTLQGHMAIYKAVLHHTSNLLPEWYLEAVGVFVSSLNKCGYCAGHHAAGLQRLLKEEGMDSEPYLLALQHDVPAEPFTMAQQAGLIYARKLTLSPGEMESVDIDAMRVTGLDDGQILEINQVAAYFAYANRTVSGLGVNTDNEVIGQSPPTGGDDSGWSHG
jgi:uncharacterized peroxidase-related enzyme